MNRGPRPPSAATIRPSSTVSVAGSSPIPNGARLAGTTVPSPNAGAMKPSPHGRFPNAPLAPSSPSSGDPRPAVERELEVGSLRARHVRAGAAVEQVGHGLRPRRHRVEVDRHHAREHVLGDAGHRRATGATVGGALARGRVAERPASSAR